MTCPLKSIQLLCQTRMGKRDSMCVFDKTVNSPTILISVDDFSLFTRALSLLRGIVL